MIPNEKGFLALLFFLAFLSQNFAMAEEESDIPALPEALEASNEEDFGKVFDVEEKTKQKASSVGFYQNSMPVFLDAIELGGNFRTRTQFFRNASLGTFVERLGIGTSRFPINQDQDNTKNLNDFAMDMRFRLNPTIHISEAIKIKSTIDILDNHTLGSTLPAYNTVPPNLFNVSNPQMSFISGKRAWAEVSTPITEIKFGRMPFSWGLGILHNSNDYLNGDITDFKDGVLLDTKILDHSFAPGYFLSHSGLNRTLDTSFSSRRYPYFSSDMAHTFLISFLRKSSDYYIRSQKTARLVYNYGMLVNYTTQKNDSQAITKNNQATRGNLLTRNLHIASASFWNSFDYHDFHLELEAAGSLGSYKVNGTGDPLYNKSTSQEKITLLNGGLALESKFGFLEDSLQLGFNTGLASFGDGNLVTDNQFTNSNTNNKKTNFVFHPAYTVDMLMYKEVLGNVSGTFYAKPHLSYFFSPNFGIRADIISSFALNKNNAPGKSHPLGLETDLSTFLRSNDGFYFSLSYGALFPFSGLDHPKNSALTLGEYQDHGKATFAQSVQGWMGVSF